MLQRTVRQRAFFKDYQFPSRQNRNGPDGQDDGKANLNNGVFICYAPADDPKIAISLVVEKGTSGSKIMEIATSIMDYYFYESVKPVVMEDNTIQP